MDSPRNYLLTYTWNEPMKIEVELSLDEMDQAYRELAMFCNTAASEKIRKALVKQMMKAQVGKKD